MTECERILDQLHRAFHGEAWHGPSVEEALAGVDAALAARVPPAGAHTVWELARHIAFWEAAVLRRLGGDNEPIDQSADWGSLADTSPAAWTAELERLRSGHAALEQALAGLSDERLAETRLGSSTLYGLLHGAVQHDLYHAGQIQMLRRIFEKS